MKKGSFLFIIPLFCLVFPYFINQKIKNNTVINKKNCRENEHFFLFILFSLSLFLPKVQTQSISFSLSLWLSLYLIPTHTHSLSLSLTHSCSTTYTQYQSDQIWRNFATLTKSKSLWQNFEGMFSIWQYYEPALVNF